MGSSEVDENIVAFLLVVDLVGQSALAPLIDGIDGAVGSDQIGELLNQLGGGVLGQLVAQYEYCLIALGQVCHTLHLLMDFRPLHRAGGRSRAMKI